MGVRQLAFIGIATLFLFHCTYQVKPEEDQPPVAHRSTHPDPNKFRSEKDEFPQSEPDSGSQAMQGEPLAVTDPPPPPPASDPNLSDSTAASGAAATASDPADQKDKIRKIILAHKLDVKSCYTRAFGADRHPGTLIYEWEYNERGHVVKISLVSTDFKMPSFERCVERAIRRISFPKSNREITLKVRYPFDFN